MSAIVLVLDDHEQVRGAAPVVLGHEPGVAEVADVDRVKVPLGRMTPSAGATAMSSNHAGLSASLGAEEGKGES